MELTVEVLRDPTDVSEAVRAEWDALAVAAGQPYSLSAWLLAGAEHGTRVDMHVVVVRESGRIVGVAPFSLARWAGPFRISSLVSLGSHSVAAVPPLCLPGHEDALAAAVVEYAERLQPSPAMVALGWVPSASPWPGLLARTIPGRVVRRIEGTQTVPSVTIAGSYDDWFAARSKSFRQKVRQNTRAIEKRGGHVRRSDDPEQVAQDITELLALHHARFESSGKVSALTHADRLAAVAATPRLLAGGHLRVWVVEHEGRVVGAQLHLRAGDRISFVWTGMDNEWTKEGMGLVLLHAAVRDAHELGVREHDLGAGEYPYKQRFADGEHELRVEDLYAVGPRYPLVRVGLARKHLAKAARDRAALLPDERREQLKRLLRRG